MTTASFRMLFAIFIGILFSAMIAVVIHGVIVTNTAPLPTATAVVKL